jgi:hypothetical protein
MHPCIYIYRYIIYVSVIDNELVQVSVFPDELFYAPVLELLHADGNQLQVYRSFCRSRSGEALASTPIYMI